MYKIRRPVPLQTCLSRTSPAQPLRRAQSGWVLIHSLIRAIVTFSSMSSTGPVPSSFASARSRLALRIRRRKLTADQRSATSSKVRGGRLEG